MNIIVGEKNSEDSSNGFISNKIEEMKKENWRIVVLVIGIILIIFSSMTIYKCINSGTWPTTEGQIRKSEMYISYDYEDGHKYQAEIEYSYRVDGRGYVGNRVSYRWNDNPSSRSSDKGYYERVLEKYPAGKNVTVHYNPDDPDEAVLETYPSWVACLILFVGISLIVSVLFPIKEILFNPENLISIKERRGKVVIKSMLDNEFVFILLFGIVPILVSIIFRSIIVALVGIPIFIAGCVLCFGRTGITINRRRQSVKSWWGLIVPMKVKNKQQLKDYHYITINNTTVKLSGQGKTMDIKNLNTVQEAKELASELAQFLEMDVQENEISPLDMVDIEKANGELPNDICPNCNAKFHIEDPESVICPGCMINLKMDGDGKLKIEV